ncbi:50S ribosomal protein L29 [Candidatus Woesearchaeota archaeon]|nr:50S ribosomal protein L29 [Candidatus Woesearchaeota archaeon]
MAIIKKTEIKGMDLKTIEKKIEELKRELMKINAKKSAGASPENSGKIKEIKRTVARLLTKKRESMSAESVKETVEVLPKPKEAKKKA